MSLTYTVDYVLDRWVLRCIRTPTDYTIYYFSDDDTIAEAAMKELAERMKAGNVGEFMNVISNGTTLYTKTPAGTIEAITTDAEAQQVADLTYRVATRFTSDGVADFVVEEGTLWDDLARLGAWLLEYGPK